MSKTVTCEDLVNAIQHPQLIRAKELKGGRPEIHGWQPVMYAGGYCLVFPYHVGGRKVAVRCWYAHYDDAEEKAQAIAAHLKRVGLPYFVDFRFCCEGLVTPAGVVPVVIMDWVDAVPLKQWLARHYSDPAALDRMADRFLQMVRDLHANGIAHGDLQHGNILVRPDHSLVLVDYDSMCVPALKGRKSDICGLRGYQHPARWKNALLGPELDYFSELVIYTSLKALSVMPRLWQELQVAKSETLVFSGEDIDSGGKAPIFGRLAALPSLKPLVEALRKALAQRSLDRLQPLEAVPGVAGQGTGSSSGSPAPAPNPGPAAWLAALQAGWRSRKTYRGLGFNWNEVLEVSKKWNR